ncbi:MAG: hypothetical protein ACFWUI_01185 [Clostridium sp.]
MCRIIHKREMDFIMKMSKDDILWYYNEINNTINEFSEVIAQNSEKINKDKKLKYIIYYAGILCKYGESISLLKNMDLNMSIESLSRDMLEYYAVIKNMFELYNGKEFDSYLKYLRLLDLKQDMYIYTLIGQDDTIPKKEIPYFEKNYIEKFKKVLKKFDDYKFSTKTGYQYLKTLFKKNWKKCPNKFKKSKHKVVTDALKSNKLLIHENNNKLYAMSGIIYSDLCRYAHGNLGIIDDKLIRNNKIDFNGLGPNTEACIEIVYYCLKDVTEGLKKIINS